MIIYIFKSSLSLLLSFGLYWFLLRKEKLLIFNRFFLVLSVAFSLIVPLITLSVNFQTGLNPVKIITAFENNIPDLNTSQNTINNNLGQVVTDIQPSRINSSIILLIIYISGVVFFLVRFLKNISFMFGQIKFSEKINYAGNKIALVDNQTNPYCFFNTIFVNKQDYLHNNFDRDLLNHEVEHIRQSHSIDIVFIELAQVIYWFNPILILFNKAIRVNHEYLADNAVVQNSTDIKSYSDKLLNFIICKRNVPLTSGFNHSVTKKRLIMITKTKSKRVSSSLKIAMTLCFILVFSLILSFKPSKTQPVKMVFIPQGQFIATMIIGKDTLHNSINSVGAFYMSNEITNKEYREFTDWAKKSPYDTIFQVKYETSVVRDGKTGSIKDSIIRKIYPIKISDILQDLIDSTAFYILDNRYKDYFTDKMYDNYPVVGVSKKMAEYYCIWKTDTENKKLVAQGLPLNHAYRVPSEMEWQYVAQQTVDKINRGKKAMAIQKSDEGTPDSWGLLHIDNNVSEWVTSPRESNGVVRGGSWKTDASINERQVCDKTFKAGYIGFRIVQSYLPLSQTKK